MSLPALVLKQQRDLKGAIPNDDGSNFNYDGFGQKIAGN